MKKEQTLQILQDNIDEIKKFHVKSLAIFGSVARGESTESSDVDILVEFEPNAIVGFFEFYDLKIFISQILHCEVDLGTFRSLRNEFREAVFKDMIIAA
jgi:uncharacterized protein